MEVDIPGRDLWKEFIAALVTAARDAGAERIEGYPVRPAERARRYRGHFETYAELGFKITGSENAGTTDILLMELDLKH